MPTPDFILALRAKVGHDLLWLVGVTAVVVHDGQVLLVRRSDNGQWTPVTGIVDPAEHPALTAEREVLEETGVTCVVERLAAVDVGPVVTYSNGDRTQYLDHTFRCRWVEGTPYAADDESTEAGWYPLDSLPPMGERHLQHIRLALEDTLETRLGR